MRACRRGEQGGFVQCGAAFQAAQLILKGCELAGGHQRHVRQHTQAQQAVVAAQGVAGFLLGHAQPRLAVAGDVGGDIVLLELGQRLAAFAQHGGDALCRAVFSQFVEQRLACGFGLLHPVVTGLQDHFGLRQVGRSAAKLTNQFQQALDASEHVEILLLEFDVLRRDAQVLELTDGVVGRERFGEFLERIQPRIPVLGFFVA